MAYIKEKDERLSSLGSSHLEGNLDNGKKSLGCWEGKMLPKSECSEEWSTDPVKADEVNHR